MFTVMIVDDNEVMREDLRKIKIWGVQTGFTIIDEAENGKEALNKLKSRPVDLLITDIRMPIIDGIQLLKKVTEKKLALYVVFFSEYEEFGYARQGIINGVFDYLVKPVEEKKVLNLLCRVKENVNNRVISMDTKASLYENSFDKFEMYISRVEVKQIMDMIQNGNQQVVHVISSLIDITYQTLEYDITKLCYVVHNMFIYIVEQVIIESPWIEKFIDNNLCKNTKILNANDLMHLKSTTIDLIGRILSPICKLKLRSDNNEILKQVSDYVIHNVDSYISLNMLAHDLYLNRSYLSEIFKQKTNMTVGEFILKVKMERAKKLALQDQCRSYEISDILGYKDINHFNKLFKTNTGLTITEYKQQFIK